MRLPTLHPPAAARLVCLLTLACLLTGLFSAAAQRKPDTSVPRPLSPAEADRQGRALVADLLSRAPEPATNTGALRLRARGGQERTLRAKFEIWLTPTHWVSTYEALVDPQAFKTEKLTVIHEPGKPNEYWLRDGAVGSDRKLTPAETMSAFAGSEFWIADLGLEFLHWPKQMLLRKELRKGQACDVLESVNPNPVPGSYSRVLSWIDIDTGGIVHADAYDHSNRLLKQFDPTALQKVNGQRQLKEMEIRNRQTGARSSIDFNPSGN